MRLIDADELKTALDGYFRHITLIKKRSRKTEEAILADVKGIIDSVPTIEERKKGKWMRYDNGTYSCSLCNSWIPEEQRHYANFCLYCGADMRGEEK